MTIHSLSRKATEDLWRLDLTHQSIERNKEYWKHLKERIEKAAVTAHTIIIKKSRTGAQQQF
jgi:hypothetical protein